jgi:hypothetical protein
VGPPKGLFYTMKTWRLWFDDPMEPPNIVMVEALGPSGHSSTWLRRIEVAQRYIIGRFQA